MRPKAALQNIGWLLCAALAGCGGSSGTVVVPTPATYDAFTNPTSVSIAGYSGAAMEPFISKGGQFLFFNNRNDPAVNTDLFYAARVDDATFT
jgi:hypothetical protein